MKTNFSLLLSLFTFFTFAQGFQGMAVYESKTSTADIKARMEGNKEISPDMLKMIEENMKKMFEKKFIMHFDQAASIYKEEEKLEAPGGSGVNFSMGGSNGTLYKNVKDKQYIEDKETFGKEFLIVDSLPSYNWKMTGESRQIGNYMCFKASATKKVDKTDFKNFRMRKPKSDDNAKKETDSLNSNKKTNFMQDIEIPDEIEITAWYAPEIPINQGPGQYWGLPGLILEVSEGKTTILCSKIVMNTSDRKKIEPATKGKQVTQAEYSDIVVKKMEEMQKMRGSGRRGGGGFHIRAN